jgi:hypothetical protein
MRRLNVKGKQTEKIPTKCRICTETPVERSSDGVGADYAFCPAHLALLHDTPAQRAMLLHVKQDLDLKRVAVAVDANGVGWFHQLPPQGPKPHPVSYDDDGFARYVDTASPHGVTVRPGVDHGIGGDE